MLSNTAHGLAVFDVDGTLIKGQSQNHFLRYLYKKKIVKNLVFLKISLWFLLYKIGILKNPKGVMEYAFKFLKRWDVAELENLVDDFFRVSLEHKLYRKGVEEINNHKKEGRSIILVSNAIEPIVKKIAEHLEIRCYIATQLETQNGRLTGRIAGEIAYGENKALLFKEFIKKSDNQAGDTWGYGDHITDIPLLRLMAHPIIVNPGPKLKKIAKSEQWVVISFK